MMLRQRPVLRHAVTALRGTVRSLATSPRKYALRVASSSGSVDRVTASPRGLVSEHGILPRDVRLLQTRSAHIAVRDEYFLFRFPPFTGIVSSDRVLLVGNDSNAATQALEDQLTTSSDSPHHLPFEHRVLESVLREEAQHKWDRYARLAQLIRSSTTDESPRSWGLSWLLNTSREAALYRLITLSKALNTLALDVKRSSSALSTLLSSDEDMSKTYLTYRKLEGSTRAIDDHIDVELLLENFATEHEDLADRIEALQDGVTTHRALEQLWLSNERNRIMRVELLLGFGTASLALCAAIGGFFGMNLHHGLDDVPNLMWVVTGGACAAATGVFGAFVVSVRRFHLSQQAQVARTAALDHSLQNLDSAYFALRQSGLVLGDGRDNNLISASGGADPVIITKDVLRDAIDRVAQETGTGSTTLVRGQGDITEDAVDDLWRLLDANGDGVLTASELGHDEKS